MLIKTLFSTSPWQGAKKSSVHAEQLKINPILGFRSSCVTKMSRSVSFMFAVY